MDDWQRVIDNLHWLMDRQAPSNPAELGRAAQISPSSVWNILKRRNCPTVELLEKIARAYGLHTWQLLAPTAMLERSMGGDVTALTEAYYRADAAGKDTILRVAEGQALYADRDSGRPGETTAD